MGGAFGAVAADSVSDENMLNRPDMTKKSQENTENTHSDELKGP